MLRRFLMFCAAFGVVSWLPISAPATELNQIETPVPAPEDVVAAPEELGGLADAAPSLGDALIARWIARLETEVEQVRTEMQVPRTVVPAGPTLRRGSVGPRVRALTIRLRELGYLPEPAQRLPIAGGPPSMAGTPVSAGPAPGVDPSVFDQGLHDAVERFQADTGLHVDGLVGPQTLAELNRTLEDTLHALLWTIDQMRQLHADAPDDMLIVNVPSSRSLLIEDGEVVMNLTSAVGRYTRQTPLLQDDRIVNVTLNPRWSVPPTIMREDVLPLLRSEGRTGIHQSTVFLGGAEVDPASIDWSVVQPWEIFVRQSPGDHNALGRYLFGMTNDQNIFVHDTNYRGVFSRANRWVSSGCIRVENARELALYLVRRAGYSDADLDRRLHSGGTRVMPLPEEYQMPVIVTYWTATPEADRIVYHRDIYNHAAGFRPVSSLASGDPELAEDGI